MKDHQKLYAQIKKLTDAIKMGHSELEPRKNLIRTLKCNPKTGSIELLRLAEIKYEELVSK